MLEEIVSVSTQEAGSIVMFSIGHSNQPIDAFLSLLLQYKIQALVDVRSSPYSRYTMQFNSDALREALQAATIKYLYMGEELGGRPHNVEFYDHTGRVLYKRVAQSTLFKQGIRRLIDDARVQTLALLCSEEDPTHCHRHLLIGRVLAAQGVNLRHIRGDGSMQTEEELLALREKPAYEQSLWGEEIVDQEEQSWRSIQPVLRRSQPPNSLEH